MTKLPVVFLVMLMLSVACSTRQINTVSDEGLAADIAGAEILSIAQALKEKNNLPVEERIALYHQLKNEHPGAYNFENEDELTMYGYSLLWAGLKEEAIAIFKLIVEQFPESSNPYDSLGEGYMVIGDTTRAIANYKRSLALNPDNFNADDQIERMRFPDRIPETPAEKFIKVFTPEAYKEDLDQLGQKLIEVHPNALKFITLKDFRAIIEKKKSLITDRTTYGEFAWHCSEIIAAINCSHTTMGSFYPESEMLPLSLRFPLQTRWVNDQLFVIDPFNNADQIAIKDEILTINDRPVADVIQDIYRHVPSQGYVETTKQHFFNTWSTGLIPYALGFPEKYKIRVKGKNHPVILSTASAFKDPYRDNSIKYCDDNLCFEIPKGSKNAVLTISSFNYYPWNNLNVFEDFMDRTFIEINKEGIRNLVIDLRFNGGGSSESSIYLLRYLTRESFTYFYDTKHDAVERKTTQYPFENAFTGKCYFIIDGNGQSTTGHFMSIIKVQNRGIIVGEELGSNQFCTAGQTVCRLSNTKLLYYVANTTSKTTVNSLPDETGILPDHYVTQGIDDYLNKVDAVKQYTWELINK
ncbi:MAG: S41 family peptidase [Saprospiraceae bacterium]|nr:PDZ domain-containing protein [Lewinella sp.]